MEIAATDRSSKGALWTGRIITGICVLFLLFDAIMKIIREKHSVAACAQLGWPESSLQDLGMVLLGCTVLYVIPRTATLGAILVTAYLGGATAINFRVDGPIWFSIVFGVLIWTGLALRNGTLRGLFLGSKS